MRRSGKSARRAEWKDSGADCCCGGYLQNRQGMTLRTSTCCSSGSSGMASGWRFNVSCRSRGRCCSAEASHVTAVKTRHTLRCRVSLHDLSRVHRKGDLGGEVDGMKRKRRRRLQRVPEAFERCRCAHDVHSCFLCHASQMTYSFKLLCFSLRELADDARVSSQVVLCCFPLYGML